MSEELGSRPVEICPQFTPGPWKFTGECNWTRFPDSTCQYCGSMHPATFMERVEAGTVLLGATDKSYKIYVHNNGGERFKQTYRDCGTAKCKGPETCTHWTTRDTDDQKFYFQHLSVEQRIRFVDLNNAGKLKFEGYPFYVLPFFMTGLPR